MWNKAKLSVFMAKNSNGTKKKKPFFWAPDKPEVEILGEYKASRDEDHGRAIITVEDEKNPTKTVVIALYADKLIIRSSGGKTLNLLFEDF